MTKDDNDDDDMILDNEPKESLSAEDTPIDKHEVNKVGQNIISGRLPFQ